MQKSIRLVSGLYIKLALLTAAVGFVLRIVLLFNAQTTSLDFSFGEWLEIFLFGAVNDLCAATVGFVFLWLFMLSVSRTKYTKPWGWIILALLAAAFCYVAFFNTIFDEYGSVAPRIATCVLGYWAGSFALRLFLPEGFRNHWTTVWFALFVVLYVGAIVFNGISEYFFWNEFGVRYNFIAVDYLVYTNEVVGNIMESYPVVPMTLGIVVVTLLITWYLFRRDLVQAEYLKGWRWKAVVAPAYIAALFAAIGLLNFNTRFQDSGNVYVNELQANGLYKFYDAFVKNSLDYEQFYITRPEAEAEAFVHGVYGSTGDNLHAVSAGGGSEIRRNIVLVTIESMSASYMERFGNTESITPVLDSLYRLGMAFDRVYATGNRTVRGLEAVTLSLPPCPGQSIIKRPNNAGMHSTGALLREKGYNVTYFYGGNSYFDNMETFFSGNGYDIVDQKSYSPEEITFANIWGVCDEDAYRKVIRTLGEQSQDGKPFFAHVMTVSNHRPFTYPAGKIRIPNDSKTRAGGVLYTDYALGQFLAEASKQPWFDNTIFLITADHCASSAGRTEIPLHKYHIPALIFAPGFVAPQQIEGIVSQIDLMPTLLSLLDMDYDSHFYGRSIFDPDYVNRAFIATYQDLGYLEGDTFTILSPVRRYEQYRVVPTEENPHNLEPAAQTDTTQLDRAVYYYQTSCKWHKR
ncbi:LTA synthase family protein [Alistipes senegalensis]|uniref:LTA synthase family protein n=1 Tax=Alistipes senegalensis JC50 TaxID=1033732 RepID=A0ABY5V932_9BACT|nr:LTA synthase family protein [Alistipes senegalensis]UEA87048.1 LTA synthase family protein [Alistipes senegalensis]UWN65361.1 LTA synthase family protein [Alistipes senegalensis JC50]